MYDLRREGRKNGEEEGRAVVPVFVFKKIT